MLYSVYLLTYKTIDMYLWALLVSPKVNLSRIAQISISTKGISVVLKLSWQWFIMFVNSCQKIQKKKIHITYIIITYINK